MGTWGVGIYQNDISVDVKEDYIAKLKSGKSDEVADVYFFLTKDKPESIDALRTSKRVCFHIGKQVIDTKCIFMRARGEIVQRI